MLILTGGLTPRRSPKEGFLRMRRVPTELVFALAVILAVTLWYVIEAQQEIPGSSGLVGHGLGVLGFVLMLGTESLYTLRKRLRGFTWGPTSIWLQAHVFTGLVGPYLVLLHTAGKFHGLAGAVALLTIVLVASGFVGRYLYTATPRTLDGLAVAAHELHAQLAAADRQLQTLGVPGGAAALAALGTPPAGWVTLLARPWLRWRQRRRLGHALRDLRRQDRVLAAKLDRLLTDRYRLYLQVHSLVAARNLLALWHSLHVPLSAAVFSLAFLHVGAALYYATFLK